MLETAILEKKELRIWPSMRYFSHNSTRCNVIYPAPPHPVQCWSLGNRKDQVSIEQCVGARRGKNIIVLLDICNASLEKKHVVDNFLNY